jgi:hypothetical protein
LAQITLAFGMIIFPFVNMGLLLAAGYFAFKNQNDKVGKYHLVVYTAFFVSMLMLLNVNLLRESYFWASSSFNYTLGTLMVLVLLRTYNKYAETGALKLYMVAVAFLAGASTEQMGMTAILALFLISFIKAITKQFPIKKSLLVIIPTVIGLVTIFLSPATAGRLGSETGYHVISSNFVEMAMLFLSRFSNLSKVMYEANFAVIFAIFGALVGVITFFDKSITKILRTGFVYSAIVFILHFMPFMPRVNLIFSGLSVFFFVFCGVVLIRNKNYVFSSILIFSALFSLFVMIPTTSHDPRVTFPAALLIMAVCANFATKCKFGQQYVLPIFVVICCVVFLPIMTGFRENKLIMTANIERVRNGVVNNETIFYNIDFNDTYRHLMAHDDGFFYQHFRRYHRLEWYNRVMFFSDIYAPIYTVDGIRLRMPIQISGDNILMPINQVITTLGGSYSWSPPYTWFYFNENEYVLDMRTGILSFYANGEVRWYDTTNRAFWGLYQYWYAEDILNIFGISYEYTEGKYVISPP